MKHDTPRTPGEETQRLLHELQVRQSELEMQNEELRRAQAEIEAGRTRYFNLYDLAPVGYVTVSEKGLILEANLTSATLLGVHRAALVRQPLTRFIRKEDQDVYYLLCKRLSESPSVSAAPRQDSGGQSHSTGPFDRLRAGSRQAGSLQTCELRMIKPDGSFFWAQLGASATEDPDGATAYLVVISDITERKRAEESLKRIEWMLSRVSTPGGAGLSEDHDQGYGDLADLNRDGIILKSIGLDRLKGLADDYLDLLGTSSAIYETNGDYAFGIFASGWCRMMDCASRKLCDTTDNAEALNSGRWLCHESCWTDCCKQVVANGAPVDIACYGGIRMYAVPIMAHGKVVGVMNIGYGDPPKAVDKLHKLAETFHLDYDDLVRAAHAYDSRPLFIIELAKKRLHATARLIGAMIETKQSEEALRKSESLFRKVFDILPIGLWIADKKGTLMQGNPAGVSIWGMEPKVSQTEYGVFKARRLPSMEEIAPEAWALAHTVNKGETIVDELLEIDAFDGKKKIILNYTAPILDGNGAVEGAIVVNHDITERKLAEDALQESEQQYRLLFQDLNAGVVVHAPDTRIILANDKASELLGLSIDQMTGKTAIDPAWGFVREDTTPMPLEEYPVQRVLATRRPIRDLVVGIHRPTTKDRVWVLVTAFPEFDVHERLRQVVVTFVDITERKRAEAALTESEERFKTIANYAVSWESWFGPQGEYIWVNPAVDRFTGYSAQDILALPDFVSTVIADEDRAMFMGRFQEAIRGSRGDNFEFRYLHKNGAKRWLSVSWQPIYDAQGNSLGTRSSGYDITVRKQAEKELQRKQAMLAQTEALAHVGSWEWDVATDTVFWSDELFRIFRRAPDLGAPSFAEHSFLYPPEDCRRLNEAVEAALREGTPYEIELHALCMDGAIRTCMAHGQAEWKDGRVVRLSGFLKDITARKQAEAKVEQESLLSNTIIDSIPGTFYLLDEQGRYVRWNTYQREVIVGKPEGQIAAMSALDTIHPEDRALIQAKIASVLQDGKDETVEGRVLLHGGPAFIWMLMTGRRMPVAGRPFLVGTGIDITERKLAEQERLRLSMAIDQTHDAVVVTDHAGAMQYVNPAFEKVTGYSRQEALGQNPRILKSGKHDAEFYRRLWATLAAGQMWNGHMINKRKDGTLYEEDATISPVRDASGTIVNFVAVKRDVTHEVQLKAQLQQAQKMEAIGRLAGGVAHDFNNLLMGIMSYAELCLEKLPPDHPVREWLGEITQDAQRSAEITRQLLAFARKQTIAPRTLDLNAAVGGMLKLLRRLIGEDINLAWMPGLDVPPVRLDPSQVDQILANLCVNARDAIAGVGKITIETGSIAIDAAHCARHPEALPGAYVFLAVSDDGCGMDKETLAQVFEPFFTTKGIGQGTGLGLATVYGIVKQNSGFIDATSEPGKGATFKIYLPQLAAATLATPVTSKTVSPGGRGETILLVEDEKSPRVTCRLFLEAIGYQVLVAETPGEALRLTDRHPGDIQLLLTDVVMPGMDGRQLAKRISAVKPGVKVLFMSGYTADVIAQRGVLDEGVQFLSKPFTRDDLACKVREMLDAH